MTGKHRYFADKIPSGLINASEQIQKMMKVVKKDFGNFYIGGFSQGAMVATDAVLHSDENPLGLILMSGAFVAEERWKKRLPLHKNLKIFQDHGESDPVLSFSEAKRLSELFLANGNSLQFLPFGGGHEIPPPVLKQLQQFLL
jgi:phospholipase/carboxylesterase